LALEPSALGLGSGEELGLAVRVGEQPTAVLLCLLRVYDESVVGGPKEAPCAGRGPG
jgi:hypothetical protein